MCSECAAHASKYSICHVFLTQLSRIQAAAKMDFIASTVDALRKVLVPPVLWDNLIFIHCCHFHFYIMLKWVLQDVNDCLRGHYCIEGTCQSGDNFSDCTTNNHCKPGYTCNQKNLKCGCREPGCLCNVSTLQTKFNRVQPHMFDWAPFTPPPLTPLKKDNGDYNSGVCNDGTRQSSFSIQLHKHRENLRLRGQVRFTFCAQSVHGICIEFQRKKEGGGSKLQAFPASFFCSDYFPWPSSWSHVLIFIVRAPC